MKWFISKLKVVLIFDTHFDCFLGTNWQFITIFNVFCEIYFRKWQLLLIKYILCIWCIFGRQIILTDKLTKLKWISPTTQIMIGMNMWMFIIIIYLRLKLFIFTIWILRWLFLFVNIHMFFVIDVLFIFLILLI